MDTGETKLTPSATEHLGAGARHHPAGVWSNTGCRVEKNSRSCSSTISTRRACIAQVTIARSLTGPER
jgi:hypothetical protein